MSERRFIVEEEGLPDIPGMMLVTIEALRLIGGSATIQELDEKVVEIEGASEEEQAFEMVGVNTRPRMNYYLAWARTYLRRGGAVENSSRAVWTLTESGRSIADIAETQAIYDAVNSEERAKKRLRNRKREVSDKAVDKAVPQSSSSRPSEDSAEDEVAWEDQLLNVLKSIDPSAFERLAQRLLRECGFVKVEVRGKSGDGGIDGVGVLRVNLVSFQVFFQCKRYKGSVGASEIRDFRGAMMGRADKGLFITTGSFTAQARDEATRDGATAIDLIDGPALCSLLKEYEVGVSTKMVEHVAVHPEYFESI